MDQQKLRTLVFEKTGVRIDVDDPIFALVALNEAVLADAVERHVALMDDATADLADQIQLLQDSGAGCRYEGGGSASSAPAPALLKPAAAAAAPADKQLVMVAGGAALLCAFVVLAGQALFFRPAPLAPVVVAKELTSEQNTALRDGEKLKRVIEKLDQKTRNTIQQEMQKP